MLETWGATIGERIRFYRRKANMTQKKLAELCEVSEPAIRNYELGNRIPDWEMLDTIAGALEVSYYALADPEINAFFGAMHTFFRMEAVHGLKPVEVNGKTGLVLDHDAGEGNPDYLQLALDMWKKARDHYDSGEWDKETYLTWESKYPVFSNAYALEILKDEGTPGADKEKKTKHKRPRKSKK